MSNVVPISKRNIALGRRFGPPSSPRSFPNVWSTVDDVGGSQAVSGPSSIQHIDARGPVADRIVLEFAQAHMFSPGEVTLRGDRVCRVNPQLARNVVGLPSVKTSDRREALQTHRGSSNPRYQRFSGPRPSWADRSSRISRAVAGHPPIGVVRRPFKEPPLTAESGGATRAALLAMRAHRGTGGSNPPPSSRQSVSREISPCGIEKPAVAAGAQARPGGTAGRDPQGSSKSRQLRVVSLSGAIPVPQCR